MAPAVGGHRTFGPPGAAHSPPPALQPGYGPVLRPHLPLWKRAGVSALCGPSCLVRRQQQARHRIRLERLPAEGGGEPGKFKLLLLELC